MSSPPRGGTVPAPSLPLSSPDAQVLSSAAAGQAARLEAALAAGGSPNALDWSGDTALLLAARGGHAECARLLLRAGADTERQGRSGHTALMVAILAHDSQLFEAVLRTTTNLTARTDAGLSAFQLAARAGRPELLRALLQRHHQLLAAAGAATASAGRPLVLAMYAAVAAGAASCLQLLVSDPLARAAYAAEFQGSQPEEQQQQQQRGGGHGGPSTPPQHGVALCSAAQRDRLQAELSFLLDADALGPAHAGAAFLWQTGGLPVHLAAATNQADCLHVLLASELCPPGEPTAEGFTPLHLAATANASAAAAVLLGSGSSALEARNAADRTPLFLAAVGGCPGVLAQLVRAGAQVDAVEGSRGYTPLIAAVARGASLAASGQPRAPAFIDCARLLLASGADVHAVAKDGSTALHAAAEGGSVVLLELLLGHGAELDAADRGGRTPLAGAASGRAPHPDCVLLLLERGAAVGSAAEAANILSCLLAPRRDGDGGHGGDASVFTVWQLLGRLHARQLKPLTACAAFFDLPHAGAPRQGLPPPAVEAMLELAVDCCSNLLYNVSPSDNASHGRRPAYLFELLRRLAWACRPRRAAAAPATAHGGGGGASGQRGAWEGLRAAVAASPHVAKLLGLWASAQALLSYAGCIACCRGVPASDRQALSCRVGSLFGAYHALGGVCAALHLSLSAGLQRPLLPLAETSADALGPVSLLVAAAARQPPAAPVPICAPESGATGSSSDSGGSAAAASASTSSAASSSAAGSSSAAEALADAGAETEEGTDAAESKTTDMEGVEPASAAGGASESTTAAGAVVAQPADEPQAAAAEPAIAAALLSHASALGELVEAVADEAQLGAWTLLLEYGLVASLATKQRLLSSLIAGWPRRLDSQMALTTGRSGVLQRVCTAVEEGQAAAASGGGAEGRGSADGASSAGGRRRSIGSVLWHGVKVAFEEERGVGDGLRREWCRLLAAELTDPMTGLLESHDGGATFAPAPHSRLQADAPARPGAHLPLFELCGCLLGVALLQGCTLLRLRLTPATWRAALGQAAGSCAEAEADLAAADPQLARALGALRTLPPAEVAALGLVFEAHDALGRAVELVPGCGALPVTASNLEQYIAALARHKQVDSLAAEAAALGRGLRAVLTGGVVDTLARCFTHAEINLLIGGLPEVCPREWQAHARYEAGCERAPQVAWLWAAVGGWAPPARGALLAFVTGASSLPAGGFAALRGFNGAPHPFTVCVVAAEGDDRLPRASTCFNTLFLPSYSSAAVLEARLLAALEGGHAFDEGAWLGRG